MDNRFNKLFPSFDSHNQELSPGSRIIDIFSSHFSFYSFNNHSKDNLLSQSRQLDNLTILTSSDLAYALVVTDASIKNNVATSISYIHVHDKPLIKTIHHMVNITTTEAKLFAIRYSISQAMNIKNISKIIVITDSLHTA